jgi:hypothetical protein
LDSSTCIGDDNAVGSLFHSSGQTCLFDRSIRTAHSLIRHDFNPNLSYRPYLVTVQPI